MTAADAAAPPPLPGYDATIPSLLSWCTTRFADHELAVTEAGRRIRYRDIDETSARLARRLLAAGVGKGTRVGLLQPHGPEWIAAYLAVGRIGAVAVTLSTFARPAELSRLLRHSDVHLLLAAPRILGEDSAERLERALPDLRQAAGPALFMTAAPYLRAVWMTGPCGRAWATSVPWDREASAVAEAGAELLAAAEEEVHPADPLVVVYTSGTASEPKGVIHTHGTLVRQGENLRRCGTVVEGDRVLAAMPFFWVGGLAFTLGPTLASGATLLLQERFEASGAVAMIERERATTLLGWITVIKRVMEHPDYARRDVSSMGSLGGGVPRPAGLGMTETCSSHTDPFRVRSDEPGFMGRALPGVEHRIADPRTNATLPPGVAGEVCVRGYNLLAGMVKVERRAYLDSDGWLHTGDKGVFTADGDLLFRGRLTEMIKTKGMNVAPAEVESVLQAHPAVAMAVVVGLPDPEAGEAVAAALVFREDTGGVTGATSALDDVRTWVAERVASYKSPSRYLVLTEAEMPLLGAAKPDRRALRTMFT